MNNVTLRYLELAQEALNNVVQHANANCVKITLNNINSKLVLRVEDNGIGIKNMDKLDSTGEHLGIIGMHERCNALGGGLKVNSCKNKGTLIECTIPK